MCEDTRAGGGGRTQQGFALIVAILALMLLTFLGLTLAVTTSTEMQIATNYRWGQQAYYIADGGLEVAKRYLRQAEWNLILPPCRSDVAPTPCSPSAGDMTAPPTAPTSRPGPYGEATRNFELADCDTRGNIGYGVVLDVPTETYPWQNTSEFMGSRLNGSFTLWIRRPIKATNLGDKYDNETNDRLILTSEGTAPYSGAASTSQFALSNRAVRTIEITLRKEEAKECDNRTAQAGASPLGTGFDQCDAIRKEGILGGVGEPDPNAQ